MNNVAVRMEKVSKRYKHFQLDHIDLELPQGQIMGFIGPNGAGKSTTIRILMGLVYADSGSVSVLGQPIPEQQAIAKRDIGFVSDDLHLYPSQTLAWHIKLIRSFYSSWDESYAASLLERFDLRTDQRMKGLSQGQRIKTILLLALARRPKLLLLDEPTAGLDPVARREVLGALMEVLADENRTILFSSHNTLDVEMISDRITMIDRGRIVVSEDKESLLERWRRIRIEMPENAPPPAAPNIVHGSSTGRLSTLTTDRFGPHTIHSFESTGARIIAVEPMTLEEIFLTQVEANRGGGK